ncbi:MAG: hypothetical protein DRH20_15840 [Deltaproteobacteria bacterium]|nr:MAG: hypothetical protein DRH20_15840 [Deltaproteobacteria bacterium]
MRPRPPESGIRAYRPGASAASMSKSHVPRETREENGTFELRGIVTGNTRSPRFAPAVPPARAPIF